MYYIFMTFKYILSAYLTCTTAVGRCQKELIIIIIFVGNHILDNENIGQWQ